jgi:DNA-binding winged helix-turn-helix (wHTH) protein
VSIRFGSFTLDLDTRQLTRDRQVIHLSPKAFQLLATLTLERPKVLSKSELQQRLWPDTFVAEANLSNLVAEIRKALGDSGRSPSWIRTVHGLGYAFCGETIAVLARVGPSPLSTVNRSARHRTRSRCGHQARCIDGFSSTRKDRGLR